jgi:hypothetical protein
VGWTLWNRFLLATFVGSSFSSQGGEGSPEGGGAGISHASVLVYIHVSVDVFTRTWFIPFPSSSLLDFIHPVKTPTRLR